MMWLDVHFASEDAAHLVKRVIERLPASVRPGDLYADRQGRWLSTNASRQTVAACLEALGVDAAIGAEHLPMCRDQARLPRRRPRRIAPDSACRRW